VSSIHAYTTLVRVQPWVAPAASAGIIVAAVASVGLCLILDEGAGGEGFPGTLFTLVLLFVALSEIIITRFFVLPSILTNARAAEDATPQGIVDAMAIISLAFANAPAIYGTVIAVFTANLLYVTPFPVLAAITLSVLLSYAHETADVLKQAEILEAM
jgi:hypothetical protein